MSTRQPAAARRIQSLHEAIDLAIEDLEGRQLMANDPLAVATFSSGGAWLNVTGSANDDEIVVTQATKGTYTITNGTWSVTKKGVFVGVRVLGNAGNDKVSVGGVFAARASLVGGDGDDTLIGGALNDILLGGAGLDSLVGNAGNDALNGEAGNDALYGGVGNDALLGGLDDDLLDGGIGNDALNGQAGNDTLAGGDGNDNLIGDVGNDGLDGGTGNDALAGGLGDDALDGGTGNDAVNGNAGNDTLAGGDGNDNLLGDVGDDNLDGGAGNDVLNGQAGNDSLSGGDGNDSLLGDLGNDTLLGQAGNDTLNGGLGDDSVDGGADNDRLLGDLGADVYVGGAGLDQLDYTGRTVGLTITLDDTANDGALGENDNVGSDLETVIGGNAADSITGDANANVLYGGAGNDTITGGEGADRMYGGAGADVLNGDAGMDTLFGQADADKLYGGDGDDLLEGGAGNDALDGGAGDDHLIAIGGGAFDSVTGGEGLDSFWLDSDATEQLVDVSDAETAARAVHRVKSFVSYGRTAVSKDILGQKLADPTGSGKLVNFASRPLFESTGPSADDIGQGQVGDCWFLSSMGAIAKTMPEVLRQSITSLGDGTYAARFTMNGVDKYVRVDADLYGYSWAPNFQMYARSGADGCIWAPLLEKALTWVRGGRLGTYGTISAGWMSEACGYFGLSSANWGRSGTTNVGSMIDWLKDELDAGKAVTMGTGGVTASSGLVGGHAYTVVRVVANDDGTYSVVLRNPWGSDGNNLDDGANDGYVTLTADTMYANNGGLTAAA